MAADEGIERLLAARHGSWLADGRSRVAQSELDERCTALGRWLREAGLDPNEVSHAKLDSSVPGVLVLLALLRLGDSFVLSVPPAGRQGLALEAPRLCRRQIAIRPEAVGAAIDLDRPEQYLLVEPCESACEGAPAFARERILLRTSGSFGSPKLVVHRHATVVANAGNAVARLDLRADDRVLIPVPIGHMYGLGAALLPALLVGADIELLTNANLLSYLERERAVRPTVAFLTPNLARTLIRPRARLDHARHVVVAGDKLDGQTFAALEAIYGRVINLYGSTELGVICADAAGEAIAPDDPLRATTVGRPLPGVELELAAAEHELGELLCRHPHGFEGYVNEHGRPLAEAGRPFATRDLARIHADGRVELHGRCDHAVKRDGRLVALADVEAVLTGLDGVELAAVTVGSEGKRGRDIVAFCQPRAGAEPSAAQLRRACQDRLPAYAVPDEIRILAKLPQLASGKLDRKALQAQTK